MLLISKEDFEISLPVGVSANDDVYASVVPIIDATLNNYYN